MRKKLIIVGAGSVGKFIAYNIENFTQKFEIIGFLDDDNTKHNTQIARVPVLGKVNKVYEYSNKNYALVWGIAFPKIKFKLFEKYKHLQFDYPNFISKKAWACKSVILGKGCIIYPGCNINYESEIQDFVVLNMNCAIGHNCTIHSFTSLSPGVNLGGHTDLSCGVEMGIGCSTKQGVTIGNNSIVGGLSMVISNIPENVVAAGIPSKIIKGNI